MEFADSTKMHRSWYPSGIVVSGVVGMAYQILEDRSSRSFSILSE